MVVPNNGRTGDRILQRVPDELPQLVAFAVLRVLPRLAVFVLSHLRIANIRMFVGC